MRFKEISSDVFSLMGAVFAVTVIAVEVVVNTAAIVDVESDDKRVGALCHDVVVNVVRHEEVDVDSRT